MAKFYLLQEDIVWDRIVWDRTYGIRLKRLEREPPRDDEPSRPYRNHSVASRKSHTGIYAVRGRHSYSGSAWHMWDTTVRQAN